MQQAQIPGILDPNEAPEGYYAVLKDKAKPTDDGNICRACDWRKECQKKDTDFSTHNHRCMSYAVVGKDGRELKRNDGCSVVFKHLPHNAEVTGRPLADGPVDRRVVRQKGTE